MASQLARRWILKTLLGQAPAILAHSLQLAVAISLSEAQANLVQTRPSRSPGDRRFAGARQRRVGACGSTSSERVGKGPHQSTKATRPSL